MNMTINSPQKRIVCLSPSMVTISKTWLLPVLKQEYGGLFSTPSSTFILDIEKETIALGWPLSQF